MGQLTREVREIASSSEWLRWREGLITASRVSALFGEHKFMTKDDLAKQLRGERTQLVNAAMRRGRILEPAVLEAVREEHTDWDVRKASTFHIIPELRLGATPDAWLGDDGLIQCKTVNPEEWDRWRGRAPLGYVLQTLTEMMVCEKTEGWLAVLVTSSSFPLHMFQIDRHPAAEAKIIDTAAVWWSAFDAGEIAETVEPPDIDDGSHRDLSTDNLLPALLPERAKLKADESRIKARLKEIDYEITNRVGTARTAWLPGWMISLPTISRKAYSVAAGTYRRLDVKESEHE